MADELKARYDEVLDYWFGKAAANPAASRARRAFWFESNADTDRDITSRFSGLLEDAASGALNPWAEHPCSNLALIVLMDQFPRNIYRGTADAYKHDPFVLELSRNAVDSGFLNELSLVEQVFTLMPFEHSEELAVQEQSVELFRNLFEQAPEAWKASAGFYMDYAVSHKDIIERFGRFPHRNEVLGREPTDQETEYLDKGGATFGQTD